MLDELLLHSLKLLYLLVFLLTLVSSEIRLDFNSCSLFLFRSLWWHYFSARIFHTFDLLIHLCFSLLLLLLILRYLLLMLSYFGFVNWLLIKLGQSPNLSHWSLRKASLLLLIEIRYWLIRWGNTRIFTVWMWCWFDIVFEFVPNRGCLLSMMFLILRWRKLLRIFWMISSETISRCLLS